MQLPNDLRLALERELRGVSPKQLAAVAAELSARYREGHSREKATFLHSAQDVTAYAATRMPATWAAIAAALRAAAAGRPDWQPRSQLDVGAGPASAAWAAASVWPGLERITLLEREGAMIKLGRSLAAHAQSPALRGASWAAADLGGNWQAATHDLVTLGYVLGELPAARIAPLVERLWSLAGEMLVIVEPGTPRGFALVRQARAQLIAAGAHVIAPCPHAADCPLAAADWCHFAQRIERTRIHRSVKGAELGYEDEKFSYIAVARHPATARIGGRVLRHPQTQPGRITLQLCTADGLRDRAVGKRDAGWREARGLSWGDAVEQE